MKLDTAPRYNFGDVLIRPTRSKVNSRADVDLTRSFAFPNGQHWKGFPLIAANMDSTGTLAMARALLDEGALVSLHKFYEASQLIEFFSGPSSTNSFYTMGIGREDVSKFHKVLESTKLPMISVDVANGYIDKFVEVVRELRSICSDAILMAGTVATAEMTQELVGLGVDIVRVGIGSGSACITRKVAGVGVPQLSAVAECADAAHKLGGFVCSDGGCKSSGDIAKALGAGADFVMLGGIFAGHDECEGEWIYEDQGSSQRRKALKFHGMSSEAAMIKHYGGVAPHRAPEGIEVEVAYKGPVSVTVKNIKAGVSSAMTYVGAKTLAELPELTTFVLNSHAAG